MMKTLYLFHNETYLKIICEDIYAREIKEHFCCEMVTESIDISVPTFTLIISEMAQNPSGIHARLINDVFHNATIDCWINNEIKICWIANFSAETESDKNLCIRFFCSNMFNRLLELRGYIGIHSSCVNLDGIGIAFIGERMAGKTTCMLNLIDANFSLICNDASAMRYLPDEKCVDAYGVPNDVFIRMSTDFCKQEYINKYFPIAKSQGVNCNEVCSLAENRIMLTHKALAKLNHVLLLPATKVDLIIMPKYVPGLNRPILKKSSEDAFIQYFLEQETELIHDSTLFLYEMHLPGSIHGEMFELATQLSHLPCYYCEYSEMTTRDFVMSMKLLCKGLKQ